MNSKILKILGLQPQIPIFFSRSLEQFFLTVGQNNFGNKIPFPLNPGNFVSNSWKLHNPLDNKLFLPMHLSAFCKPKVTMANGVYELHIVCIECIFKKHTDNQTVDTIYDFIFSYAICIARLTWRAIRWRRHERSVRSDLPACSGSQVSVLFQLHRNCLCRREFCSIETAKQAGRSERTLRSWRRQRIARQVRRAIHICI